MKNDSRPKIKKKNTYRSLRVTKEMRNSPKDEKLDRSRKRHAQDNKE